MTAWPWKFWQLYGASAAESSLYSAIKSRGWLCKDMSLRRWPHNPYDRNCVEVIRSEGGTKLGHVDRAAAEWLSPLLKGPFKMTG